MQAELKTKKTELSVTDFINSVKDEKQREDSKVILKMMEDISNSKPKMWGSAIIGFGDIHLKYASGRELDWFKFGFSPRKGNVTLYVLPGGPEKFAKHLNELGKHSTGKGCLYIKKLEDINMEVLKTMLEKAYDEIERIKE